MRDDRCQGLHGLREALAEVEAAGFGEAAAETRRRCFSAYTTSSEWLGEVGCALADLLRARGTRKAEVLSQRSCEGMAKVSRPMKTSVIFGSVLMTFGGGIWSLPALKLTKERKRDYRLPTHRGSIGCAVAGREQATSVPGRASTEHGAAPQWA